MVVRTQSRASLLLSDLRVRPASAGEMSLILEPGRFHMASEQSTPVRHNPEPVPQSRGAGASEPESRRVQFVVQEKPATLPRESSPNPAQLEKACSPSRHQQSQNKKINNIKQKDESI